MKCLCFVTRGTGWDPKTDKCIACDREKKRIQDRARTDLINKALTIENKERDAKVAANQEALSTSIEKRPLELD